MSGHSVCPYADRGCDFFWMNAKAHAELRGTRVYQDTVESQTQSECHYDVHVGPQPRICVLGKLRGGLWIGLLALNQDCSLTRVSSGVAIFRNISNIDAVFRFQIWT